MGRAMELQQLLLGRDYLHQPRPCTPGPGCRRRSLADDTPDVVAAGSSSLVGGAGLTVDRHRSTLRDVLLLRHQQHPVSTMMQYPAAASQHAAAAAAAIGLSPARSPPYYAYYQRGSSTPSQQCYLPLSHGLADGSRHGLDSLTSSMQPGCFSYEHHAALLRDRLADTSVHPLQSHNVARLGVGLTQSGYISDGRCAADRCLPDAAPATLSLASSRYYRPTAGHLQSTSDGVAAAAGTGTAGSGAFSWYLRHPVNTANYSGDCVCQWLDSTTVSQHVKLKVSTQHSTIGTVQYSRRAAVHSEVITPSYCTERDSRSSLPLQCTNFTDI